MALSNFCFVFQDRLSLCNSPSCPGTHFADEAGLKLRKILLPLTPESWDSPCTTTPSHVSLFFETVSYYPDRTGTHYVDRASLKLTQIHLLLPKQSHSQLWQWMWIKILAVGKLKLEEQESKDSLCYIDIVSKQERKEEALTWKPINLTFKYNKMPLLSLPFPILLGSWPSVLKS